MKFKVPFLLALLVLMPLLLLIWLGARLHSSEKIVVEHQAQKLADAQLREASMTIDDYFTSLEEDSLSALSFLKPTSPTLNTTSVNAIRILIQQDPMLEQVFILNTEGKRLFPPTTPLSSRSEEAFIEQTQSLWNDDEAFRPEPVADLNSLRTQPQTGNTRKTSLLQSVRRTKNTAFGEEEVVQLVPPSEPLQHGWTTWDVGAETQTFFWYRDDNSNLIGQKLAPAFWTSELINRLPDDRDASQLLGDARIKLVDKRQRVVYQWGPFEDTVDSSGLPFAQRLLDHPLDGWRLEYYRSDAVIGGGFRTLVLAAALAALGLMLITLAIYMWREYRRDMRLAAQRVTFVNQVSHELKTPLTNICMYADMLEEEVIADHADQSAVRKYTRIVQSESQRLGRLINNVLTFSRSQQHGVSISASANNINEVIRSTVNVFSPAFEAKQIDVELDLNTAQTVNVDVGALEQILNNLLSNIEKYAASGKHAVIRSSYEDGLSRVEVRDSGPGLDQKMQSQLFKPFVRGSSKLTDGVSGTGIGLGIARELCRAHGGDLRYEPSADGACFIVTLATPLVEENP